MSNQEQLKIAIQSYNETLEAYNLKPSKSNSTKTRNALMTINKLTKEVRKDVLTAQKALPVKPRIKKEKEHEPVEEPVEIEEPVVKTKKAIRTKKI